MIRALRTATITVVAIVAALASVGDPTNPFQRASWQQPDHPVDYPPPPQRLSATPYYLPNLIAAIVASIGIIVGSIGPWLHFLTISSVNGLGANSWAVLTLILGAMSGIALFTQLNWGRTTFSLRWAVPLTWVVIVAGVGCLAIALVFIVRTIGVSNDLFGTTIAVQVDWGLWMVAISSVVLCVTATVVAVQVGKVNEDYGGPPQAAWAGGWRWAAIVASALILLFAIAKASFSPITLNNNAASTATQTVTPPPKTETRTQTVLPPTPARGPTVVPADATPCPTNFVDTEFGKSAVGSNITSCQFAEAVRYQYVNQSFRGQTVALNVYSPVTGQTYLMSCVGSHVVTCTGGTDAVVYLY